MPCEPPHEQPSARHSKRPYALRQETEFTDGDYALMITLPWRAFYQKLPAAAGTEWP